LEIWYANDNKNGYPGEKEPNFPYNLPCTILWAMLLYRVSSGKMNGPQKRDDKKIFIIISTTKNTHIIWNA